MPYPYCGMMVSYIHTWIWPLASMYVVAWELVRIWRGLRHIAPPHHFLFFLLRINTGEYTRERVLQAFGSIHLRRHRKSIGV